MMIMVISFTKDANGVPMVPDRARSSRLDTSVMIIFDLLQFHAIVRTLISIYLILWWIL